MLFERSLPSALAQRHGNYEIIVVDDCGADETSSIMEQALKRYPNLSYHKLLVNRGLSFARNYGINQARGKYVVCLDDDNELHQDFLKETLENIRDYDALAVGRVIQYKDFADTVVPGISKLSSIDWGWLIKKQVFNVIHYDENLRANEDTDFGIQFFKRFRAKQLGTPLTVAYDEFGDSKKSLSFPNERELMGMILFFKKNFKEYDDPKERWCLYRLMARKFYRGGFRVLGLKYMFNGFLSYKTPRAFLHFIFLSMGWFFYDIFMTCEEKLSSKLR